MFFWKNKLKLGNTYGVLDGQYQGHTYVFIKTHGDLYGFLDMWDDFMVNRWISKKDFDFAIKYDIIELIKNPRPSNDFKKAANLKFEENEKGL